MANSTSRRKVLISCLNFVGLIIGLRPFRKMGLDKFGKGHEVVAYRPKGRPIWLRESAA